jgi:hypothetical protein
MTSGPAWFWLPPEHAGPSRISVKLIRPVNLSRYILHLVPLSAFA